MDFKKPTYEELEQIVQELQEDIQEAKQQIHSFQTQVLQPKNLEVIRRLAGDVAHGINDLLTVIKGNCALPLLDLQQQDEIKRNLYAIDKASDCAAYLTRQLLSLSRGRMLEKKLVNLNLVLEGMENIIRRIIGEEIALKILLADDLKMVNVEAWQIGQVIVSLVVAAGDTMPEGGKLFIETANAELNEEYARFPVGIIPGIYVMLSITSAGIGESKKVNEQIFDPFTVNEKDKVIGLPLSVVYGIIKQNGGEITVQSEETKGTTFKIYLPRAAEPREELKETTDEETPRDQETVLVVDDDEKVRCLAVEVLKRRGYTVLEAAEGEEALVVCETEKRPIDLVLTDIVMPHINGPELIERLKQIRDDFKVLYMTGYADESFMAKGKLMERMNLIQKPFSIEKLAEKVREVLDTNLRQKALDF